MKTVKEMFLSTLGALLIAIAISQFLAAHNIVFGGVSGISIILLNLFNVPLWATNLLANIPLLIIGAKSKGKEFVIKSVYTTLALSLFLKLMTFVPVITTDLIVATIFGGVTLGIGAYAIIKSGSSSGGTDLLAVVINKRVPKISIGKAILAIDGSIIFAGVFIFGVNRALYAMITVYFISQTVDKLL